MYKGKKEGKGEVSLMYFLFFSNSKSDMSSFREGLLATLSQTVLFLINTKVYFIRKRKFVSLSHVFETNLIFLYHKFFSPQSQNWINCATEQQLSFGNKCLKDVLLTCLQHFWSYAISRCCFIINLCLRFVHNMRFPSMPCFLYMDEYYWEFEYLVEFVVPWNVAF